jgi:hypothetical protein
MPTTLDCVSPKTYHDYAPAILYSPTSYQDKFTKGSPYLRYTGYLIAKIEK